ncbi:MAG: Ppx/GppA family phosphatase [Firmicutes bacterium]|nr:Ppx/GppA family phosphatase [Bacillota bacterium]
MARYAAVDIGTNSARLLIGTIELDQLKVEHFSLNTTRLGEGIGTQSVLRREAIQRTVTALRGYRELLKQYPVAGIRVVATSAARGAANAAEFVQTVWKQTGWRVEIISGKEEAELSYLGACRGLKNLGQPVVLDIGGGSTEFTWVVPGTGIVSRSIEIGAVRLMERSLTADELREVLAPVLAEIKAGRPQCLVGVGGTVTTLAAIEQKLECYDPERVHGYYLTRVVVDKLLTTLSAMKLEERRQVVGLQPARADIIVAGVTILSTILAELGLDGLVVSESDILQGIIWRLHEKMTRG